MYVFCFQFYHTLKMLSTAKCRKYRKLSTPNDKKSFIFHKTIVSHCHFRIKPRTLSARIALRLSPIQENPTPFFGFIERSFILNPPITISIHLLICKAVMVLILFKLLISSKALSLFQKNKDKSPLKRFVFIPVA